MAKQQCYSCHKALIGDGYDGLCLPCFGKEHNEQVKRRKEYWDMMNHLSDWIHDNYGHRCPTSSGGCAVCQAWAVYDLARAVFMDPE